MNMTRDALRRQVLEKKARESGKLNDPEPDPVNNDHPPVWPWVIEQFKGLHGGTPEEAEIKAQLGVDDKVAMYVVNDMAERHMTGVKKYGVALQPSNGRNALVDAYQEALDLCAYLGQDCMERHGTGPGYDRLLVRAMALAYELRCRIEERE